MKLSRPLTRGRRERIALTTADRVRGSNHRIPPEWRDRYGGSPRYHCCVRISRLAIAQWRNFRDFELDLPAESRFVCLVGQNGSGKTALLELLTSAAYHFGLRPEASLARPPAGMTLLEDYEVEITLDLGDELDLARRADQEGAVIGGVDLSAWDKTVKLSLRAGPGVAPPRNVELGEHVHQGEDRHMLVTTTLGGLSSGAITASPAVTAALAHAPQILSLFIDAERVFPQVTVQDAEVLQYARENTQLPAVLRQQAAALTQNLYVDWIRSLLGAQQRRQTAYYQEAIEAYRSGEVPPRPADPSSEYRESVAAILPHLRFSHLDQDERKLMFASGGTEIAFDELSAGEREIAFLAGQLNRFDVKDGLFLLDEPELHLNPDLVRRWLDYLRANLGRGQAWIATHSLEAVEVAGTEDTVVLEPDSGHVIRRSVRLADRPVLQTLSGAVGAPGFSLTNSRFVFIEGARGQARERGRFDDFLQASPQDHFIEAGNCTEVLRRYEAVRDLAWEAEQLHVGAVIDRDLRADEQVAEIQRSGAYVLAVHEIENFLLYPDALTMLLVQAGRDPSEALVLLRQATDPQAGRWMVQFGSLRGAWSGVPSSVRGLAASLTWADFARDERAMVSRLLDAMEPLATEVRSRREGELRTAVRAYEAARGDIELLWKVCRGKEALPAVAMQLGLSGAGALENRVVAAWRSSSLIRPPELEAVRAYIADLPLVGVSSGATGSGGGDGSGL